MNILDRELKPWLHGAVCVLLGFCVLWAMMTFPNLYFVLVDGVTTRLLSRKPAMELRNIVKCSSNCSRDRAQRVTRLELTNRAMSEELQKVIKVSFQGGQGHAKITLRYPDDW